MSWERMRLICGSKNREEIKRENGKESIPPKSFFLLGGDKVVVPSGSNEKTFVRSLMEMVDCF